MNARCPACGALDTWDGFECRDCKARTDGGEGTNPPTSGVELSAPEIADQLLDGKAIAAKIATHKGELFESIRVGLYSMLRSLDPSETLSFYLMSGGTRIRTVKLTGSLEYAGVLLAFMQSKGYRGDEVDSFITPKCISVIESEVAAFYARPEIAEELAASLTEQLDVLVKVQKAVRGEVSGQQKWLGKEFGTLMKSNLGDVVTSEMAAKLGQNLGLFLQSAAGKSLITTLGKMLATGAGKLLVTKIAIIVGQVVATAAFQSAMVAIVKKIGITVLVKTVIGKAIIATLALLGISASIPAIWIIAPLILGLLAYEYVHLPQKLADKVPNEVVGVLRDKFDAMNDKIVEELIAGILAYLLREAQARD